jgi:cytochrome c553
VNKTRAILLAAIALAATLIVWLSIKSRQPPLLPADETHASWENAQACDTCHGPESAVPKPPIHPLGFDCLRCHGRR